MTIDESRNQLRGQAARVGAAYPATLLVGCLLLAFFEPDVQTIGAAELVDRQDDARAFLAGDFVFIVLYAVISPVVIWRFRRALPQPRRWIAAAAACLLAAGLVDAAENILLWIATDAIDENAVDSAHSLRAPKTALFLAGAVGATANLAIALQTLRSTPRSGSR